MIAAGILMASCQEYHIDSQPDLPPTVKIDALDEYTIEAASPSRIVFNISANTPWSIETDSQWCLPTPAMSASSSLVSEIVIKPDDNDTYLPRIATLNVYSDETGLVKTIRVIQEKMREQVKFYIAEDPESDTIIAGNGMPADTIITFRTDKTWSLSVDELPEWLNLEKVGENQLKVSIPTPNTTLFERSAMIKFMVQGTEEVFEFPFKVVQPAPYIISANADISSDPATGYSKILFTRGEMFRSDYTISKGRFIIEFNDMKMSSICNLGFVFLGTTTDANFKFHMEGSYTYWFRCAGAFTWIAPIKKTYTFDEVNAIRKLEFVIDDSASGEGLIDISIYINGALYGTQAGRTDAFANGEEGCVFILDTSLDPTAGDGCTIKSITYISK